MSKKGNTKRRILELLKIKNQTMIDLSRKLNLSPSTVSQHLQEMVSEGLIRPMDSRKKWKYYELNKNTYYNSTYSSRFPIKKIAVPVAAVAIAVLVLSVYFANFSNNVSAQQVYLPVGSTVPLGSTVFTVSDAPAYYNITALYITINNASIRSASTGKWYNIPLQIKTFNLIELENLSQVLSGVKLSNGIYDQIVLNVSKVYAIINGSNQSVYLPSGKLRVFGDFNITSNTTNWINVDFNLEQSLHLTKSGKLVMLPVLFIRHVNDNGLQLNQNAIIIANNYARIRELKEYGMDLNGNMMLNYTTPQNISVSTGNWTEAAVTPIIIRGPHSLFIGGDLTGFWNWNFTNSTQNESNALIARPCLTAIQENSTNNNASMNYSRCCGVIPFTSNSNARHCCYIGFMHGPWNGSPRIIMCGGPIQRNITGNYTPISAQIGERISPSVLNNGFAWKTRNMWQNYTNVSIAVQNGNATNSSVDCGFGNGALLCTHMPHGISPKEIAASVSIQNMH